MNNETKTSKGNPIALLPILVFLIIFLGTGFLTKDFYKMPAILAFLVALLVAFVQNRGTSFQEKISIVAKGVGDDNIITMSLIFLSAGAFSGAVSAAGGVSSTVNLGLSVIPSSFVVVGLMVIGCFISISMGTSMGTIAALAPIAVGISEKTGFSLALCIGAVVCGAMFGDNLSMISDTTIAAVRTQGCEMKDKFKANFLIVLPAAIISIVIFAVLTRNSSYIMEGSLDYNIWQVLPYALVLVGALIGINVFLVLIAGTVTSVIIGMATGALAFSDSFAAIGEGITGMYDITVISIIVAAIVSLVKHYGGITCILEFVHRRIKGQKGAQVGIALLAALVDIATANNTVAIVIAGPIAKEISEQYDIEPKRSASLLDIFTSGMQGIIPYGAQLLSAATLTGLTSFDIMPYLYYPIIMCLSALCFIAFGKSKKTV
ncbi:MAG: Na+/H+ antiporter NhaC family protein [Lachnospiraceae bacterium]|nr:Na+/H+ antiporter NhaC family protein [Lachnospiraceae bacterium]MDD3615113.1 Na+/H+ antiporter NhaC family protein [Lachnospiraceae bacterium]